MEGDFLLPDFSECFAGQTGTQAGQESRKLRGRETSRRGRFASFDQGTGQCLLASHMNRRFCFLTCKRDAVPTLDRSDSWATAQLEQDSWGESMPLNAGNFRISVTFSLSQR